MYDLINQSINQHRRIWFPLSDSRLYCVLCVNLSVTPEQSRNSYLFTSCECSRCLLPFVVELGTFSHFMSSSAHKSFSHSDVNTPAVIMRVLLFHFPARSPFLRFSYFYFASRHVGSLSILCFFVSLVIFEFITIHDCRCI